MTPILWSFRRCPYAMRARLAIAVSGTRVELREILLRDKAPEFLAASPSATVPCLETSEQVLDESYYIMLWALRQNDPAGWLDMPQQGFDLIATADGPFKTALDRYKYSTRYADTNPGIERVKAAEFLATIETLLARTETLFDRYSCADAAILPFVRQFAYVDKPWFDAQPWPNIHAWLNHFLKSPEFISVMGKYPIWAAGDPATYFPDL